MKLSRIRLLGRYINPETGRPVNVCKGYRFNGMGTRFYLYRQRRVIIPEAEFFRDGKRI